MCETLYCIYRVLDPIISSTLSNKTVTGLSTGVSIQVAHEVIECMITMYKSCTYF